MQPIDIVQEFLDLVCLPVHSKDERKIADVMKGKLEEIGFEVSEDGTAQKVGGNTGNLIARMRGEPGIPTVLFSAHLDRVKNPGKITPEIDEENGVIKSDGTTILAADDVSGLCSIMNGVRRLKSSGKPHGDIEVVFSVCEEMAVIGAKELNFSELNAKFGYVLDCPGRIGRIVKQAPTKCKITVRVKGIKAHAGNEPEKGLNAIKVAAFALAAMPEGRISANVTSNFGMIQGGSGTNVVCDEVVITGEARGTDDKELEVYLNEVRRIFEETATRFNTTIEVCIKTLYHTFNVSEDSETVEIVKSALKKQDIEGFCQKGGGGSDGNHYNRHGIPTVVLGLGYSKNHTNAEQILIEDLKKAGKLVEDIISEVYDRYSA